MPDESERTQRQGGGLWQPPSVAEAAQLFPQYEVLALLGRGGMGAVYQARQLALDRFVAIKLLPLEVSADQSFADRFVREARTMGKLSHPNIIAVYDFGQTSAGHLYFAMEFVEGTNLHQLIHGPGLQPAQALAIIGEVCDALAYAHSRGVVHRDIKPANVMVNSEGRVKVADFGLARLTDPSVEQFGHTQTGMVMGTPDYMAPEQKRGMNVDHRADIYSLGVMLYEMLCRETPQGVFSPPSHRVSVDPRVDDVVLKAMQQTPERRFQDSTQMKAAVDRIRTMPAPKPRGQAGMARRAVLGENDVTGSEGRRGAPSLPKSRTPLYAGIAVAVVAIVIVAIGLSRKPEPKRTAPRKLAEATPVAATPSPVARPSSPIAAATPTPAPATPMPIAAATPMATPPAATPKPAPPATPTPTPVASTPFSDPLRAVREKGGKLHAIGKGVDGADIALGKAAEFDDFVAVTICGRGWAARRRGGDTYAVAWNGASAPAMLGPYATTYLARTDYLSMLLADGTYRNVWSGASQHRSDFKFPDATAVAAAQNHLLALGRGGELLKAMEWGGKNTLSLPQDFFLGATAFTGTDRHYVSARPGLPVRSWGVNDKITDFAEPTEEVVDMEGTGNAVILLTRSGKVLVTDPDGTRNTGPTAAVPADASPAIRVRIGHEVAAAQRADGTWTAWGKHPDLAAQIAQLKSAVDLDLASSKAGGYALWIEGGPTAAPEVVKWLAEQDTAFTVQWKAEALAPFETAVAKMRAQYAATIERNIADATKNSKVDEVIAWRNEQTRIATQQPHEGEDATSDPIALRQLRAGWRAQFAKLDAERFAKAKAVHQRFDALLATGENGYTQKQRLDDAALLKGKRDEIAKAWLTPPLSPSQTAPATASATATPKPAMGQTLAPPKAVNAGTGTMTGRDVVEWFVRMSGDVSFLDADGKPRRITKNGKPEDVPKGKLELQGVTFGYKKRDGTNITDQDFLAVSPLRKLTRFELNSETVTGSGLAFLAGSSSLAEVELVGKSLQAGALEPLLGLRNLRRLEINSMAPLALPRFGELASLTDLETLLLSDVPAALLKARKLKSFRLADTTLTVTQAAMLAALPRLETFIIYAGTVDERGIAELAKSKSLTTFELRPRSGTTLPPLSPAAIEALKSLRGLRSLSVQKCGLTPDDYAALRKALPKCQVSGE